MYRYVIAKGPKGPFFYSDGWTDNIWRSRLYKKKDFATKELFALEEEENRGRVEYPFVTLILLKVGFIIKELDDLSFERAEEVLKNDFKKIK